MFKSRGIFFYVFLGENNNNNNSNTNKLYLPKSEMSTVYIH